MNDASLSDGDSNGEDPLQDDDSQGDFVGRIEVATQKIRDVVAGNVFHPLGDVELISYEEVLIEFEAQNSFSLHSERTEKIIGKPPGGLTRVQSQGALDKQAAGDLDRQAKSAAVLSALKDEILKRPDRGYFWDHQHLPLAMEPLQYVLEEPCGECRGQRTSTCTNCKGAGHISCQNCKGAVGLSCNLCQGRGEKQCMKCQSKGRRNCHKCQAVGSIHHLTRVTPSAQTSFSYDQKAVPEVALSILERLREKLVTKKHAWMRVSDDLKSKKKKADDHLLTIQYNVQFPLGDAVFRIGEEEVPALVFGYKAALLDVPPFLERYMLAPFNLLREAAQGQGNIANKIRSATYQTRLTNQAVIGVAMHGAGKTNKMLRHDYSIALEPQFIHSLVKAARGALNKLTAKPQMMGLAFGLIPVFILSLLYVFPFNSGGTGTPQSVRVLMDILFLAGIAFLPFIGARIMARQAIIRALGAGIGERLKCPKLGALGLWGPTIAVILFLFFAESAYRSSPHTAPQLYSLFRGVIR